MNYKELILGLKGLIKDDTDVEVAQTIGKLIAGAEQLEADNSKLAQTAEANRQKFIEAIKMSGVSPNEDNPIPDDKPKTFEECVADVIAKRSKK